MKTCPGVGEKPTAVSTWYVQTDRRGNVLARLNDLAAEQLGHNGTREFGVCPTCKGEFEFPHGVIRLHHTSS